jgi:hypothetical protein
MGCSSTSMKTTDHADGTDQGAFGHRNTRKSALVLNELISPRRRTLSKMNYGFRGGLEILTTTTWPFIEIDAAESPGIQAKGCKVLQLVREHLTFDWNAEQLCRQHPHLSLPEIHAALGYYYEHRDECDAMLLREEQQLAVWKRTLTDPEHQDRLRSVRDKT